MPGQDGGRNSVSKGEDKVERADERREGLFSARTGDMRTVEKTMDNEWREETGAAHVHINTCVRTNTSALTHSQPLQVTLLLSLCKCDCKWSP